MHTIASLHHLNKEGTMKQSKSFPAAVLLAFGVLLIITARAHAAPFSFSVEHFGISGNLPGSVVDTFDDGVLSPWTVQEGTAAESGGVLTLSSPGGTTNFAQGSLLISMERSGVEASAATGAYAVADGAGNFTAESQWLSAMPGLHHGYGMTFHYPPTGTDQVRIGIDNMDALALSLFGAPAEATPGAYLSFLQISPSPGTGLFNMTFNYQAVPVSAADITGNLFFRLNFDDATNSFSAAYSLDGGNIFLQPFSPFTISALGGSIDPFIELEAMSLTVQAVPIPPAVWLFGSGLVGLIGFARRKAGRNA